MCRGSSFQTPRCGIPDPRGAHCEALGPSPIQGGPNNVLSLATVWFTCGLCNPTLMHNLDAPAHQCPMPLRQSPEESISIGEATFNYHVPARCWYTETSKFGFSEAASTVARGLILDCGEDPESITLAEMSSKFHRFVFYEGHKLVAHNWEETVSSPSHLGASLLVNALRPVRTQISQPLRVLPVPWTKRVPRVCARSRRL